NVFLAILVEQGLIGIIVFIGLLAACARTILGLRGNLRKVWTVLALVWLLGSMSLNWQYRKITWLLFGLLSTQAATASVAVGETLTARHFQPVSRRRAGRPRGA